MQSKIKKRCSEQAPEVLVGDAIKSLDSILSFINFQILGNADGLHEDVSSEDREQLKITVERMIKKPFRRQAGRMRSLRSLLTEIQRKISAQKEGDNQNGSQASNHSS